jgi:primosomal protein N' (replication factor Y)
MPPFTRLVALILSGKDEAKLKQFAASMAKVRPYDGQVSVLGPAPAPIFKLRGKYRYRFLVRSALSVRPQNYIKAWLSLVKPLRSVTMKIDVDPYTLL